MSNQSEVIWKQIDRFMLSLTCKILQRLIVVCETPKAMNLL